MNVATEIKYVRVTNRNPFELVDHYDNRPYRFPAGQPMTIPLDAAAHIFGFTATATEEATRLHCIKRFGFNRPEVLAVQGHDLFWENLEIAPVVMRMIEVEEGTDEGLEDDRPTRLEVPPLDLSDRPKARRGGWPKGKKRALKRRLTPRESKPAVEETPPTPPSAS